MKTWKSALFAFFFVPHLHLAMTSHSYAAPNATAEMRARMAIVQLVAPGAVRPRKGTGFLVSRDGFLVTTSHLFDGLSSEELAASVISIRIGEGTAQERKAFVVESRPSIGLTLLKTPSADKDYPFVKLGTTHGLAPGDTQLRLGGFAADTQVVQIISSTLAAQDGSSGRTWVAQAKVDDGLIGGPVFRPEDGTVLGIIDSTHPTSTEFVPIELASMVLIPIQIGAIMEDLRQLTPEILNQQVQMSARNLLSQKEGKDLLTTWLKGYLAGAGESDLDDYLKRNSKKLESALDNRSQHFVNYSYNDSFQLFTQGGPKNHELPFYKADGDRAILSCDATYPTNPNAKPYPNKILYTFNDSPNQQSFGLKATSSGNTVNKFDRISGDNAALYDQARPANSLTPYHKIYFAIEDDPAIATGPVSVGCTLLVLGSAKYD